MYSVHTTDRKQAELCGIPLTLSGPETLSSVIEISRDLSRGNSHFFASRRRSRCACLFYTFLLCSASSSEAIIKICPHFLRNFTNKCTFIFFSHIVIWVSRIFPFCHTCTTHHCSSFYCFYYRKLCLEAQFSL